MSILHKGRRGGRRKTGPYPQYRDNKEIKAILEALKPDTKIQWWKDNPKDYGSDSWERYEQFMKTTTIADYMKTNPKFMLGDMRNGLDHGFVKVDVTIK